MKIFNVIKLLGTVVLLSFAMGCSVDNKLEPAQLSGLPAEVQAAIAAGETTNVNLAASRAATGSFAAAPVLFPYNYSVAAKRNTPALRIKLTTNVSNSTYDAYFFYINTQPAIEIKKTDYPHFVDGASVSVFLDRPSYDCSYSVVVYAINKSGVVRFPSTGSTDCLNSVVLWYNGRLLYDTSCAAPSFRGYAENTPWNSATEYKNFQITTKMAGVSYSVYKNGEWMEDTGTGGFAGGCTSGDRGHFTKLLAYPDLTFRSYFPGVSKIGLAYRLCNSTNYAWSPWGYGEDTKSGSPALRRETSVADGVIGMQVALYIC